MVCHTGDHRDDPANPGDRTGCHPARPGSGMGHLRADSGHPRTSARINPKQTHTTVGLVPSHAYSERGVWNILVWCTFPRQPFSLLLAVPAVHHIVPRLGAVDLHAGEDTI